MCDVPTDTAKEQNSPPPCDVATSKKQQKRLAKLEKRGGESGMKAFWQAKKQKKKQERKKAAQEKKAQEDERWASLSKEEKEQVARSSCEVHEIRRRANEANDALCKSSFASASTPTIIFDLSFESVMDCHDIRSTVSQIKLSYSILRHHGFCLKPLLCSGSASSQIACSLRDYEGFRAFPPVMRVEHWSDFVEKDKVIYLTADSEEVLWKIQPNTYYIIGAFVDHNRCKGLTSGTASHYAVKTARLPIQETMVVGNMCKVLTINHVVDVLARFCVTQSWEKAFEALPTRRKRSEDDMTGAKTPEMNSQCAPSLPS